jgi:4-aminobutyrate aminotransferase
VLPIAACVARAELNVAGAFAFGHYTHEKNPVSSAAALATLRVIERDGLVEHAARLGAHALERMHDLRDRHAIVGDVRGRGLLLGIELVRDRDTRERASDAAEAVLYGALSRGLSFKTTMGNVLTLTPPLVTTFAEMDRALDIIDECLTATH